MTIINSKSSIVNRHSVLSLDPSSTVVGWSVMASATRLIGAGLITPAIHSEPSYGRICGMRHDLRDLLDEQQPATILIEWTRGKVGKRHHGRGAGLAVYGCGVGAMATECEHWSETHPAAVVPIYENDWTRGVPKRDRQLAIASMFDQYRVGDDPGGDMADAIGLGVWWFRQRNLFQTR